MISSPLLVALLWAHMCIGATVILMDDHLRVDLKSCRASVYYHSSPVVPPLGNTPITSIAI